MGDWERHKKILIVSNIAALLIGMLLTLLFTGTNRLPDVSMEPKKQEEETAGSSDRIGMVLFDENDTVPGGTVTEIEGNTTVDIYEDTGEGTERRELTYEEQLEEDRKNLLEQSKDVLVDEDELEDREGVSTDPSTEVIGDSKDTSVLDALQKDINKLASSDSDTVRKYFGTSTSFDEYTIQSVFKGVTVKRVSETVDKLNGTKEASIRISTYRHDIIQKKRREEFKRILRNSSAMEKSKAAEAAEAAVKKYRKGKYRYEKTIDVQTADGKLVITEELKEALTGGWYKAVN